MPRTLLSLLLPPGAMVTSCLTQPRSCLPKAMLRLEPRRRKPITSSTLRCPRCGWKVRRPNVGWSLAAKNLPLLAPWSVWKEVSSSPAQHRREEIRAVGGMTAQTQLSPLPEHTCQPMGW
ncbi:unnamed protein product [Gulo gulo]|uniref:Secreted protein n=1 Tax=Gulo gulo TaxID=48420 RepID=A0A9X9M0K7_GULGU|nr:unnamed protein product [Gulo gulo]